MKVIFLILVISSNPLVKHAQDSRLEIESKQLMEDVFEMRKNYNDLSKVSNVVVDTMFLSSINITSWQDLVSSRNQYLPHVLELQNMKSGDEKTDFTEVFSEVVVEPSRFNFITETLRWSSIFKDHEFPDQGKGLIYYSYPIFNRDYTYALIYEGRDFSGDLIVLRKLNDKWKEVARGSVWMS